MTLANKSTASQPEDPPEAGKELKLCVNQQEMQIIVKSLLQVLTEQTYKIGLQLFIFMILFVFLLKIY